MSQDTVVFSIKLLFVLLAVAGVVLVLLVPMVRMWRQKPDMDLMMPDFAARIQEEEELEVPTMEDGKKLPDRSRIIEQAREDPLQTAALVQNWLREKK